MGQAVNLAPGIDFRLSTLPVIAQVILIPTVFIIFYIARHIIQQLYFANESEPPVVFSWLPLIGSTIEYGIDPYQFYAKYQKKVTPAVLKPLD
jgi:sterol 14-demethylase